MRVVQSLPASGSTGAIALEAVARGAGGWCRRRYPCTDAASTLLAPPRPVVIRVVLSAFRVTRVLSSCNGVPVPWQHRRAPPQLASTSRRPCAAGGRHVRCPLLDVVPVAHRGVARWPRFVCARHELRGRTSQRRCTIARAGRRELDSHGTLHRSPPVAFLGADILFLCASRSRGASLCVITLLLCPGLALANAHDIRVFLYCIGCCSSLARCHALGLFGDSLLSY